MSAKAEEIQSPAGTMGCECEPVMPCAEALELSSFYRAGRFLSSILNLDELLRAILEECLSAVNATRGFVALVNRHTGELEPHIKLGQGWDDLPIPPLKVSEDPGYGITGRVAATGVPYVTGDVRRDPNYLQLFDDVRSELTVPLVDQEGCTIGVIDIESEIVDHFTQRDLQLLVALAGQASIAISVAHYREREAALIAIGNELATSSDMDELLKRVVKRTAELLRADNCSIFELNPGGDRLILRHSKRPMPHLMGRPTYRLGEGLTGWVAQEGKPIRVADVRADPRWRGLYPDLPDEAFEAYVAAPVYRGEKLWGVLRAVRRKSVHSAIRDDFSARDEEILITLAGQVGAAVTRQRLNDRQVQMERMAAWGEMSARSAHMIGNKVFGLKGQLNELEHLIRQREISKEAWEEVLERAKQGVFRLEEILNEFRDFLMATQLDTQPFTLNDLVQCTVSETFNRCGTMTVELDLAEGLGEVCGDSSKLRRALSELLENASIHQNGCGAICVRTGPWGESEREAFPQIPFRREWARPGGAVRVEVIDRGPGVPADNKTRLFDPFFTTRSKGMGLGLSIVKGIIDAHRGVIAEIGEEGKGAHFVMVLPARCRED